MKLIFVAILIATFCFFQKYPTNFETEAATFGCEIFVAIAVGFSLRE